MRMALRVLPLLAGALFLSGCFAPFNFLVEGPGGELAVVLDGAGEYEPWITGGGAVWLVGKDGVLERPLLRLGEREGAGDCLLYTSPSPRDRTRSRMPSSA